MQNQYYDGNKTSPDFKMFLGYLLQIKNILKMTNCSGFMLGHALVFVFINFNGDCCLCLSLLFAASHEMVYAPVLTGSVPCPICMFGTFSFSAPNRQS